MSPMKAAYEMRRDTFLVAKPVGLSINPFEVFISCLAIITAVPLLVGVSTSNALTTSLPEAGVKMYAIALILGGVTVAYGVVKHSFDITTMGLRLTAIALIACGICIIIVSGISSSGMVATVYVFTGLFCGVRSMVLRAVERLYLDVLARKGTE